MIRVLLGLAATALAATAPFAVAAGRPQSPVTGVAAPAALPAGSFLSLWPACGCGRSTVLAQFSLAGGRRVRTLARVPGAAHSQVAAPHAAGGRVWLTFSAGPRCSSPIAGCGPVPNSCTGSTVRYDPVRRQATTVLTTPPEDLVADAVPSPDGRRLALISADCAHSFLNFHLVVRDLGSGRSWSIGADARPCHTLSEVAWSQDGADLAFPFGPSRLSRRGRYPAGVCPAPRSSRLAVVSATRASSSRSWRVIAADPGCSYAAAAFTRRGLVAIESCAAGTTRLVVIDARHRITARFPLARGYNDGALATDWRTATVLVSEYQAANQGRPVYDWVWALHGRRLRLVARYPNRDAPTVIAAPWHR
jgi:hypothetical protein